MHNLLPILITCTLSLYPAAHEPSSLFHHIAKGNAPETHALLTQHPEWLNIKNDFGKTPLCVALQYHRTLIIRNLLERGADVHAYDNEQCSPLYYAFSPVLLRREYCLLLLEHGHDPFYCSPDTTPIVQAAKFGMKSVTELLLKKGICVNQRDAKGVTPLEAAAGNNHVEVVQLLLEHGADIYAHSNEWSTPLHWGQYWQTKNSPMLLEILTHTKPKLEKILPDNLTTYLQMRELGLRSRTGHRRI